MNSRMQNTTLDNGSIHKHRKYNSTIKKKYSFAYVYFLNALTLRWDTLKNFIS